MKNIFFFEKVRKCTAILAMTVVTTVLFPLKACAKEVLDEPTTGVITMTTMVSEVTFSVVGDKDITVDWGDGKKSNVNDAFVNPDFGWFVFTHEYSETTAHQIVVTGNVTELFCTGIGLTALDVSRNTMLTRLHCSVNQLTTLDVSKNTALTDLNFSRNQLTALDVSKNIALERLEHNYNQITRLDLSHNTTLKILSIVGNKFTASALNDLFRTLPDYSKTENMSGVIYLREQNLFAEGNPGNLDCDRNIAMERGWEFMSSRFN